jgi:hypothetical protein
MDVVVQYLQRHPQKRHLDAAGLAIDTLTDALCPS